MISRPNLAPRMFRGAATCLVLAGMPAMVGCGHPGEGTVQVSPEARERLSPRVSVKTSGPKGRIVGQRPIGIKNRGVAGTMTP
jgi:hypothetical protein